MNVLGSFGNLYMAVLLILLSAGLIFTVYEMVKKTVGYISESRGQKGTTTSSIFGGMTIMKSSGWLKLAVFSFFGLIISVVLLNVTNPTAASSTNDQHSVHVNGTANATGTMGNMSRTVNGTVNGTVNMDQMNEVMQRMNQLQQDMMMMQQQYMNGMQSQSNMNMGTSGGMSGSGGMMDDDMDMNMGGSSGMSGSGSSSSGGMGMM